MNTTLTEALGIEDKKLHAASGFGVSVCRAFGGALGCRLPDTPASGSLKDVRSKLVRVSSCRSTETLHHEARSMFPQSAPS